MNGNALSLRKNDRTFYKTAAAIAIPIIFQQLIGICLNMIDTMMIGKLGVNELSGVGAANRVFFVFVIVCFGFYSGCSVLLAQYYGAEDTKNIRRILGIDYIFGASLSLLVMAASFLLAPQIISLFADEPEVIDFGVRYLRIVQISYIFTALTYVLTFNCRAIHRLVMPTIISCVALGINTFLNYCLIYGNFGLPKLGVEGAAIATVIARVAESIFIFIYVYRAKNHPLAGRPRELFSFGRTMLRRVLHTTYAVVISEGTWSIGNAVYYIAYGKTGGAALAVVQVASVAGDLFQAIFFGVGNACAVMIGNELGRHNTQRAYEYAKDFLRFTLFICIAMTVLFWFAKAPIIRFYDFDAITSALLDSTLNTYVIYLLPRMLTYTLFIGILRAGGDTRFCMLLDVGGIWCIGVPLAFLSAIVFQWQLPYVVALSLADEFFKLFICLWRLRSRRWINVLI